MNNHRFRNHRFGLSIRDKETVEDAIKRELSDEITGERVTKLIKKGHIKTIDPIKS